MTFHRPLFSLHTTSPAELSAVKSTIEKLRADIEAALNELSTTTGDNLTALEQRQQEALSSEVLRLTKIIETLEQATNQSLNTLNDKVNTNDNNINTRVTQLAEAIRSEFANADNALNEKFDNEVGRLDGRVDSTNQALNLYKSQNDQRSLLIENDISALQQLVGDNNTSTNQTINTLNSTLRTLIKTEDDKLRALIDTLTSNHNAHVQQTSTNFSTVNTNMGTLDSTLRRLIQEAEARSTAFTEEQHQEAVDEIILTTPAVVYGETEAAETRASITSTNVVYDATSKVLWTKTGTTWASASKQPADALTAERFYVNTVTRDLYYVDHTANAVRVEKWADRYLTVGNHRVLFSPGENTLTLAQIGALPANHTAVTNPREWTAATITQAEVEAGTATTRRAFTAQRLAQAIAYQTRQHLRNSGGTIDSGDLLFTRTGDGLVWSMNTDGAGIRFNNAGDQDPESCLEFYTLDNDTGYFRWAHKLSGQTTTTQWMELRKSGLTLNVGKFTGNGSGLTNLPASSLTGVVPNTNLPTTATRWPTLAEINAVPVTRTINNKALSANITLSYGDVGACSDTDPRLSNSREWTAATVSQAEAEAGVATTRRAWTAQMVRAAVMAYTEPGSILNPTDLGTQNIDDIKKPYVGFQDANVDALTSRGYPEQSAGALIVYRSAGWTQVYYVYNSARVYVRSQYSTGTWTTWSKQYNTDNKPTLAELNACANNDSRLTNSREWTASTVPAAEAQAGTATTRRAWTADLVRQAIDARMSARNVMMDGGTYGTLYLNNWMRCNGNNGLYFQTHGGGWHMTDTTWIRSYGSKKVYVNNDIASTAELISKYSDERLKTNVEHISDALGMLRQWDCVTYTANELAARLGGYDTDKVEYGFLAGQIKATAPELTTLAPFDMGKDDKTSKSGENYLTVNYPKTTPIIAAAVKQLDSMVQEKDVIIANQAKKLESLEERIAKLEQLIMEK